MALGDGDEELQVLGAARDAEPAPSRPNRHLLAREVALAFAVALVVAVASTWPLARHLTTMVDNATDALFQAWTIEHVQWALSTGAPLWDANIFAPNESTLAYSDNLLGLAVPMLPLRWLGMNPIGRLNVALLLGMAASAAAAYAFGRVVTGRRLTGAVTAAAFVFGPFAFSSTSHLHTAVKPGIAVAATAAWVLADRARAGGRLLGPSVLLVAAIAWQTSVSFYPGAYALGAAVLVLLLRWQDLGRDGTRAAGVALVAGVAAMGLLALPYAAVLAEGRDFVQARDEVANLGADFTAAPPRSVWGSVFESDSFSFPAFPGVALLGLSAVGLVAGLRGPAPVRRATLAGAVLVAVGAFLALGTASSGWRSYSPYGLLFDHVPGFSVIRAAARAWAIGLLGAGILAGTGCAALVDAVAPRRRQVATVVLASLAVAALLVEGHVPWDDRPRVTVSAVDRALADDPRPGGVVYLPLLQTDEPALAVATTFGQVANVYGTTAHHRTTPNGYSGLAPDEWPAFSSRMRALPASPALDELRAIGVRFVVVRAAAAGTAWAPLLDPAGAGPLRLVGRHDDDLLYELPAP